MNSKLKLLVLLLIVVCQANNLQAQFSLDFETGAVTTAYNDVRIPGKGGDFISLSKELQAGTRVFGRLKAGYMLNERSELLLLIAPLRFIYTGSLADKALFQGTIFPAGRKNRLWLCSINKLFSTMEAHPKIWCTAGWRCTGCPTGKGRRCAYCPLLSPK